MVNLLSQLHVDSGNVEWAMISRFRNLTSVKCSIVDIQGCFAFQIEHSAGIRDWRFVHFTPKSDVSCRCLVPTMHDALMLQYGEMHDSGDSAS